MRYREKYHPGKWASGFEFWLESYPGLKAILDQWLQPSAPLAFKPVVFILIGGLLLTPLVKSLPMLGFDWHRLFYQGILEQYPPWMAPIFAPLRPLDWRLSLGIVNSITLLGVATITALQAKRIRWDGLQAALLALLTPSMFYLLWDGQIDGLVLLGLSLLPWSMPLALLRPQILGWVLLSRMRWLGVMVAWIGISFLIWGFWPAVRVPQTVHSIRHPTAMGWATLGWPIFLLGLVLLSQSKGHFWRMMAAGMLASPYVQPYHMVLLWPALGRVHGWKRYLLWGWAWVVGVVPAFMGITRYLGLGYPLAVWWLLREDNQKEIYP